MLSVQTLLNSIECLYSTLDSTHCNNGVEITFAHRIPNMSFQGVETYQCVIHGKNNIYFHSVMFLIYAGRGVSRIV